MCLSLQKNGYLLPVFHRVHEPSPSRSPLQPCARSHIRHISRRLAPSSASTAAGIFSPTPVDKLLFPAEIKIHLSCFILVRASVPRGEPDGCAGARGRNGSVRSIAAASPSASLSCQHCAARSCQRDSESLKKQRAGRVTMAQSTRVSRNRLRANDGDGIRTRQKALGRERSPFERTARRRERGHR